MKTTRSGYAAYIPHVEEYRLMSWHDKWKAAWKEFAGKWRGKEIENAEQLCINLDEFLAKKNVPFATLIPTRNLIAWYNLENNFIEFEGLTDIRSLVGGFGGSGGQKLDYHKAEDGTHCYGSNYVGGAPTENWDKTDPLWFATHFCTPDQWGLINFFG